MPISQKQKEILIGNILGDGHIVFRGNQKCAISFGYADEDYSKFVFNSLKGLMPNAPRLNENKDKRYNFKVRKSYTFNTINSNEIFNFAKHFLQPYIIVDGKPEILEINMEDITSALIKEKKIKFLKILPAYDILYKLITRLTLAIWICDDGMANLNRGTSLCTDNFNYEEIDRLKSVLTNKFKLICTYHEKENISVGNTNV